MEKRTRTDIAALIIAVFFIFYTLIMATCSVWSYFLTDAQASSPPTLMEIGAVAILVGFFLAVPLLLFMIFYLSAKSVRCSRAKNTAPFRYAVFPAVATAAMVIAFLLLGVLKHIL